MEKEVIDLSDGNVKTITTNEMLELLQRRARMNKVRKSDRLLLLNAAHMIYQLVNRLAEYETPNNKVN
jgi:hypothetical protein